MGYLQAAIFLGVFTLGGLTAHQYDKVKIIRLQAAMTEANNQAEHALQQAQAQTLEATAKAEQLNRTLDEEHQANLAQVAELSSRVAAAGRAYHAGRMHPQRQSCADPLPAGADSNEPATAPASPDFPDRLAEIVRRADETAVYAQSCWQFVTNNCGIAQGAPDGKQRVH